MTLFNDMIFHDLQIFSAVVSLRSYKKAAEKLEIDVSNIGRRIKVLEEQLNCQLVIRNNREIIITPDGIDLYQEFVTHELAFNEMLDKFQESSIAETSEIDIAIPNGIIEYILSTKVPNYLRQHPNVTVNMICQAREMNLVAEKYDLAILRHIPRQDDLKIKKIYEIKIQLYCTKEYKERYGVPETLDDINQHMILGRVQDNLTKTRQYYADNGKESVAIYLNTRFLTNNTAIDKQVVMGNEVIVSGNDYLYREELASGKIIKVLPEYHFQANFESFYLVSDGNKYRRKIVQNFMDFITEIFAEINESKC